MYVCVFMHVCVYLHPRLERLVEGEHEPSSFLRWQKEMQDQDLQGQRAQLECQRLEGRISHTKGATARGHLMERNQRTAQLQKEEVDPAYL